MDKPPDSSFADGCKTWRTMYVELWCAVSKCQAIEFGDRHNEIEGMHTEALTRASELR